MNTGKKISRRTAGFTLIEIMIVVMIIGMILIVSIPNILRTRVTSNEVVVQADMQTIATGVEIYRSSQTIPVYPPDMQALGTQSIPILDAAITAGKQHGYNFSLASSDDGSSYTCVANPIKKGITGNQSFCIDQSGMSRKYSRSIKPNKKACPPNANFVLAKPVKLPGLGRLKLG